MICNVCDKQLNLCQCPDIDERMKAMAETIGNSLSWCVSCDHHWQRCKCDNPHLMLTNEIVHAIEISKKKVIFTHDLFSSNTQ